MHVNIKNLNRVKNRLESNVIKKQKVFISLTDIRINSSLIM